MRPIAALTLSLLPADARPLGFVVLNLALSWSIAWRRRIRPVGPHPTRVGLLLLALATLLPLAYASPPDPSWIPGLYDDADDDNVVVPATSEVGNVAPRPPSDVRPVLSMVGHVPRRLEKVDRSPSASVVRVRAPPAS